MTVEAIAFDLDGTLTDWWSAIEKSAGRLLAPPDVARLLDSIRRDAFQRDAGVVVDRHLWRVVLSPESFFAWESAGQCERFRSALLPGLYPDVIEALDQLRELPLALVTNNPDASAELERLGLAGRFSVVVALEDDSVRKPAPYGLVEAANRLGVEPVRMLYVGDSPAADVAAARAAGARPVWLDRWDDSWTPPPGTAHVKSLLELPGLLARRGA